MLDSPPNDNAIPVLDSAKAMAEAALNRRADALNDYFRTLQARALELDATARKNPTGLNILNATSAWLAIGHACAGFNCCYAA